MSLLNGLAAGLGSFAASGLAAEQERAAQERAAQELAAAAQKPAAAPVAPAAPAAPAGTTPWAAPAAAAAPAGARPVAGPQGVPPALLPIYAAASKRTGIPIAILIAQAKQESDFNPDAVGSAGEIGLHQIKPSTAAAPGYGVAPIDPKTLRDPAVNINFAADYLRARAGLGADFSNTGAADAALARYNGGGDPNYVANVRRHMGAG